MKTDTVTLLDIFGYYLENNHMYQDVYEQISVIGIYTTNTFIPKKFLWHSKEYLIREITWKSDVKDGGVKKRFYSVMSGNELYRIEFNRETENWILQQIWIQQ